MNEKNKKTIKVQKKRTNPYISKYYDLSLIFLSVIAWEKNIIVSI